MAVSSPGELRRIVLADGSTLSYREYGEPAGTPLIFFHGWPGSSAQGVFLHRQGMEKGLRVISPDRPGLGGSSRIPDRRILHFPPLVDSLAESLGLDRFEVLGMSGGGPYALACAWALPHRVRAAAVCCGAPPLDTPEARKRFSPVYRALLAVQDRHPNLLRSLLAPMLLAARVRPPWPLLQLAARAMKPRDRLFLSDRGRFADFYPSFRDAARSGHRAVYDDGRCYALPWGFDVGEIRVPVSLWHGSQDTNFHYSLAEKLAARIPGATFHLREEGHYSLAFFSAGEIIDDLLLSRAGR